MPARTKHEANMKHVDTLIYQDQKIRPDLKTAWLEALRSGDYTQSMHSLRTEVEEGKFSFCCLGVMCDIHPKLAGWKGVEAAFRGIPNCADLDLVYSRSDLGSEVLEDIGLGYFGQADLMHLNDNGSTFSQIADFIEKHL